MPFDLNPKDEGGHDPHDVAFETGLDLAAVTIGAAKKQIKEKPGLCLPCVLKGVATGALACVFAGMDGGRLTPEEQEEQINDLIDLAYKLNQSARKDPQP